VHREHTDACAALIVIMGCTQSREIDPDAGHHHVARAAPTFGGGVPRGSRITSLPAPWRSPESLTAAALERKRQTFWDTGTQGGHPQMWQNLKLASEALLVFDLELANTILESTGCVCPQPNLTRAPSLPVYDATGALCVLFARSRARPP
jgi:hypothetical protein